jgi:hypothetical protein
VAALEGRPDQVGQTPQTPTTLPPSGAAGGDLSGSYPDPLVGPDAVGPGEIANLQRAINLPLGSFTNCTDGKAIDFTPAADNDPDFILPGAGRPSIEWDADDTDSVCASVILPSETVTNSAPALRWMSIAATGSSNWAFTALRQRPDAAEGTAVVNGATTNCDATFSDGEAYVCSVPLGNTVQADDALTVGIARSAGSTLRMYGAELQYLAAQ